jgi:ADP-heptose:LPS heptosyltransferase
MRKLILKCKLSPGDILMLTAAVRDLHLSYPNQFLTDVRTSCRPFWDNNPYITPISDDDPDAIYIECEYPLIHESNQLPVHFIHGFRTHLSETLGIAIRPTAFKGDIHLSDDEKKYVSRVDELTGEKNTRFWIIVSGGKNDFTTKLWDPSRYQEIVDHFADRIKFVQCGAEGEDHNHSVLNGVVDLVGQTDLRQMVRLMYHADGVICPITMFMHLAAAVETKLGRPKNRPCVVVAGGREPSHWEAYSNHRYLHRNGSLPCCDNGGCWKCRVTPIGDGSMLDRSLCHYPVSTDSGVVIPKCLDMISTDEVIGAIESYLSFDSVVSSTKIEDSTPALLDGVQSNSGKLWPMWLEREKKTDALQSNKIKPDTFSYTSPYPTSWLIEYLRGLYENPFGKRVLREGDFEQKINTSEYLPETMLIHNFVNDRVDITLRCIEAGINILHTEDGFFPHYGTFHADPVGFCWESSLTRMIFRRCDNASRELSKRLRCEWLNFEKQELPIEIKKPYVVWPLQLIHDRVNFWDLNVTEWTALIDHFRKSLPEEYQLVIKPHPKAMPRDMEGIKEYVDENSNTVLLQNGVNLKTLVYYSNAVAGANSSVLYEARLMFHKPVYAYARGWYTNHTSLIMPISKNSAPRLLSRLDWLEDNLKMRDEELDDYTDWFLAQLMSRQLSKYDATHNPPFFKSSLNRLSYSSYKKYGEGIFSLGK